MIGVLVSIDRPELLSSLDSNYLGWSRSMAPVIMGNPERPELTEELTTSFCRIDPVTARQFANVTFRSDKRADLAKVTVPTLVVLDVSGHCPHLSAPEETSAEIRRFIDRTPTRFD